MPRIRGGPEVRGGTRSTVVEWGVAQPAERLAVNQEVGGSNPPAPVGRKVGIKRLSGSRAREAVLVCAMLCAITNCIATAPLGVRHAQAPPRAWSPGRPVGIRGVACWGGGGLSRPWAVRLRAYGFGMSLRLHQDRRKRVKRRPKPNTDALVPCPVDATATKGTITQFSVRNADPIR